MQGMEGGTPLIPLPPLSCDIDLPLDFARSAARNPLKPLFSRKPLNTNPPLGRCYFVTTSCEAERSSRLQWTSVRIYPNHALVKVTGAKHGKTPTEEETAVPCKCAVDIRSALEIQRPISLLNSSLNV